MNKSPNSRIFQLVAILAVIILLIRFFPLAIRAVEYAALNIGQFWWVILILVFTAWIFSITRKKR